jgi:class 3 adenylate cyclase
MAVSPGALLRMIRMCRSIDVRDVLPAIRVPTLVIQQADDRIATPCHGRYLAAHIQGARYFEQPGEHLLRLGDTDAMFAEIERFLAQSPGQQEPDRVLTTILCADTRCHALTPAEAGACAAAMAQHVRRCRGNLISSADEGILATFDAPGRAIRCAVAGREAAALLGIQIQAAIHTGEAEIADGDVRGTCVDIARYLAGVARPAEILVTRTVKDLVAGSGITFASRVARRIAGTPGSWQVFTVIGE